MMPDKDGADAVPTPTREEIETLCVLHVIGVSGSPVAEVAALLGLSGELASVVANGLIAIERAGWLKIDGDVVTRTARGQEYLERRVAELSQRAAGG